MRHQSPGFSGVGFSCKNGFIESGPLSASRLRNHPKNAHPPDGTKKLTDRDLKHMTTAQVRKQSGENGFTLKISKLTKFTGPKPTLQCRLVLARRENP